MSVPIPPINIGRLPWVILLLVLSYPLQAIGWSAGLGGCSVFDQTTKQGARIQLPAGPATLPRDETGQTRGYRARSSMLDAGDLTETIYDCPQTTSAFGLAAQLRQRLRGGDYKLRFTCAGPDCGKPEGWAELLDLDAKPMPNAFTYTLARRRGQAGVDHVAVYTADLDQRPRVLVFDLRSDYTSIAKRASDQQQVKALYARHDKPLTRAQFASGSADIENAQALLRDVRASAGADDVWVVVGHADRRGQEAPNGPLSWRRALAVSALLSKYAKVDTDDIRTYAVGSLMPVKDSGGNDASRNRRVDVFRIQPKAAKKSPPPADQANAGDDAGPDN